MPSPVPPDPIWELSVLASPSTEEAIAEVLTDFFAKSASSYRDFETGKTTVTVYLDSSASLNSTRRRALNGALARIAQGASGRLQPVFSVRRIRNRDWANSWKLHFKPIQIGSRLLIKPGWSRKQARPGQKVLILNPGLSFGTGQHPTTLFCLRHIARMSPRVGERSFLDIGTGSGILAIAAARLGYSPVDAFDFDPKAVQIARQNAKRNRVLHKINLREQDVTKLPPRSQKKYSLICANLLANLLIEERDRIVNRLEPDGRLVTAGILEKEFETVALAYEQRGMNLISARRQGEWRSGFFSKKIE